jgi:nitroreductase
MHKIDFFEVIARRHSYRDGFEPTEVSKEHLEPSKEIPAQ